ncbi:hypothetical protein PILCRDRAFT_823182 [Piloderma croceum F 1598]|uniref:F-box domain-containing protein n=1 Tax=Piloderma croceum (strain F 1598) TaxID=765440 RepID=A0A0C3BQT4_PILCF|nr:hypothetical protein PILCRDRAFT_823182 [Piloderma croceum F 1598]
MSVRKSARLEIRPATTFNNLEPDAVVDKDDDFVDEDENVSNHDGPSRRKRVKTKARSATKNPKGKKGRLGALPDMPLDILFEIFGHLRPYDILRLAQTTKALRHILMRRSAVSVWKDARSNVEGLPDCPSDLTEPQYARLAFDPFCFHCDAPNVHTVLWACRLRSCQKCINNGRFMDSSSAVHRMQLISGASHTYSILPRGSVKLGKYSRRHIIVTAEFDDIWAKLDALAGDKISLDKFLEERQATVAAIQSHASLCEQWYQELSTGRQEQLQGMKGRRKEAIFTKLREMGWGDEIDKNSACSLVPLTAHALVKKPQELTDRIWNNIKQPLVEILEELKEKRLTAERLATFKKRQNLIATLLKAYTRERPVTEVIPGPTDVCNMDEFRTIIEDTDVDVEVTEANFKEAMNRLPQLVTEWRITKDEELVHIMNEYVTPSGSRRNESQPQHDHTQLELATTFFQCKICNTSISYPRILVHSCVHSLRDYWRDYDEFRCKLWLNLDDEPWNFAGDRIGIYLRGGPPAREIVMSCGLDPDTTTAKQMDDLDARFECLGCYSEYHGRLIMAWRTAVTHYHTTIDHSSNPIQHKWTVVNEADCALVKKLEMAKDPFIRSMDSICCARCGYKTFNSQFIYHLKSEHGIEEVSEDDYLRPLDAPPPDTRIRLPPLDAKEDKGSSV